jgi:Tfp pilus assembly protein PilN
MEMINLLPYDYKEQILYARKNRQLVKWSVALGIAMFIVIAVSAIGTIFLYKTTKDYEKIVSTNKSSLEEKNLEAEYKDMEKLSANFKTVVDIASQQLIYSRILKAIAPLLPADTELNGLELTQGQSGVEIKINGASQETLTQAFINLSSKNNGIFEKADFNNVSCKEISTSAEQQYPCTASIKGLLAKNSSFYFINSGGKQ